MQPTTTTVTTTNTTIVEEELQHEFKIVYPNFLERLEDRLYTISQYKISILLLAPVILVSFYTYPALFKVLVGLFWLELLYNDYKTSWSKIQLRISETKEEVKKVSSRFAAIADSKRRLNLTHAGDIILSSLRKKEKQ